MVDALEKSWRALRDGGYLVDVEPDDSALALVTLSRRGRADLVAPIQREVDPEIVSAQHTLDVSLARGLFAPMAVVDHPYTVRYSSVGALEQDWKCHSLWLPDLALRRRLRAASKSGASRVRLRLSLRLTVLRRAPTSARGS